MARPRRLSRRRAHIILLIACALIALACARGVPFPLFFVLFFVLWLVGYAILAIVFDLRRR